ncbi:hypothetical protein R1sor_018563 [Riccia sorocarpa]|uniref:Uncharacterized protein n=1 Tax=Riccia sorocarpa TaxID=122646 RepID=A0ABD3IE52_9MARC
MRNKADSVSLEISRLEKDTDSGHAQLEDILRQSRLLAAEIIQLQQEHEQTSTFYEKNKEQMELCRKNFEEQNLSLRDEITDLEKEFDELNRGEDARKKQLLELDESIVEEEEKGRMLASMKEKLIHEIASNSLKVEKMEAVVERAVKESDKEREELETLVLERRRQLNPLQEQNKYWENQIYKHMQARGRMQEELEVLENRAAQASRALYG